MAGKWLFTMRNSMNGIVGIRLVLVCCLAITGLSARQAAGALGETVDSVATDRRALSAAPRATTGRGAYTVQEMTSGAQTVREYVSTSTGIVFAVAWNGRSHPDLDRLLGSYAGEYRGAAQRTARKRGLRRRQVVASGVVVETWGHMRNLQGKAYAPQLVPPGVGLDEIR